MLNRNLEEMLKILSNAVLKNNYELKQEQSWNEIYKLLVKNNVSACCFQYATSLPEDVRPDEELLNVWKVCTIKSLISQMKKVHALKDVIEAAKKANIRAVVFKGIILAELYPGEYDRTSSDTDILIRKEDLTRMDKVLQGLGYMMYPQKDNVMVYVLKDNHIIELHTSLWEDYEGEKIEILEQLQLDSSSKLIWKECYGTLVETLGYTEHLIYLMFHIIKHFSLEGIGVKCMLDISLYIKAYSQRIDWKSFWNAMQKLRYVDFCKKFFNLCQRYLGVNETAITNQCSLTERDAEVLMSDFALLNREELENKAKYEVLHFIEPYFCDGGKISSSKLIQNMKFFFPTQLYSDNRYGYAKKNKVLLPIAWCQRVFDYFQRKRVEDKVSLTGKLDKAQQRLGMMKLTGLID